MRFDGRVAHLDEICLAGKSKFVGEEREGAEESPAGALFVAWEINILVREIADDRVLVGSTETLDELERGAALAVEVVVEGAEGERVQRCLRRFGR